MGPRRYIDEAEIEELVAKRLQERKEFVTEAMEALKPQLTELRESIDTANHIKRDLGGKLAELTSEVREKNQQLRDELSLDQMSAEEKRALPEVLGTHVRRRRDRRLTNERSNREMATWLVIATLIGSVASAIVAVVAVLAFEASRHLPGIG